MPALLAMSPGVFVLAIPVAIVVLGLLLWGVKNPLGWTVLAVVAIAVGIGFLATGITNAALLGDRRTNPQVESAAETIGFGAGATAGGITLLVVSLVRRSKSKGDSV